MRDFLMKTADYIEDVNFHITNCDESCEDLARCLKALKWNWANSNFETPSGIEVKNVLLNLYERGEKELLKTFSEDLEKFDGCYTIASGGFILNFYFNNKTMELYHLDVLFDIWQYKMKNS